MKYHRAARLEKYLRETLGWETGTGQIKCVCGFVTYMSKDIRFCSRCGKKLPKPPPPKDIYPDLEAAISFSLGEK